MSQPAAQAQAQTAPTASSVPITFETWITTLTQTPLPHPSHPDLHASPLRCVHTLFDRQTNISSAAFARAQTSPEDDELPEGPRIVLMLHYADANTRPHHSIANPHPDAYTDPSNLLRRSGPSTTLLAIDNMRVPQSSQMPRTGPENTTWIVAAMGSRFSIGEQAAASTRVRTLSVVAHGDAVGEWSGGGNGARIGKGATAMTLSEFEMGERFHVRVLDRVLWARVTDASDLDMLGVGDGVGRVQCSFRGNKDFGGEEWEEDEKRMSRSEKEDEAYDGDVGDIEDLVDVVVDESDESDESDGDDGDGNGENNKDVNSSATPAYAVEEPDSDSDSNSHFSTTAHISGPAAFTSFPPPQIIAQPQSPPSDPAPPLSVSEQQIDQALEEAINASIAASQASSVATQSEHVTQTMGKGTPAAAPEPSPYRSPTQSRDLNPTVEEVSDEEAAPVVVPKPASAGKTFSRRTTGFKRGV